MSNPTYFSIEKSLNALNSRLERNYARLESLKECSPTRRRLAQIERLENAISQREERAAGLTTKLESISAESLDTPEDTMTVSFAVDPITGQNFGLNFSISDTGYDDTFVGETPLTVKVSGSGRWNGKGWSSFGSRYGGIVTEDSVALDGDGSFSIYLPENRINGDFKDVSVSLVDDNNNIVFSQVVYDNGVAVI